MSRRCWFDESSIEHRLNHVVEAELAPEQEAGAEG